MNLRASAKCRKSGFTMIEIAIAVGVIGFAVVAIIGILPYGMSVQKDNREDTIIAQDAPFFINAIRNGEMRTNNNFFANYVELIEVATVNGTRTNVNSYPNPTLSPSPTANYPNFLTNDMNIVGLLNTPEWDSRMPGVTNYVTAYVRAMTGSALTQSSINTNAVFRYQLVIENLPYSGMAVNDDSTNYSAYVPGSADWITRSNSWTNAYFLTNELHDVRLRFAWPLIPPTDRIGPNRQTYRTLVSAQLMVTNYTAVDGPAMWFFQPLSFTNVLPPLF